MDREMEPLRRRLGAQPLGPRAWTAAPGAANGGIASGISVILAVTGMGSAACRQATRHWIQSHHPERALLIGLAGSLRSDFPPGQLCAVDPGDARPPWFEDFLKTTGAVRARLYPADRVLTPEEKLRAGASADIVDMESRGFLEEARGWGVSAAALRVVLDAADERLPEIATDGWGRPNGLSVFGHLLRKPWTMGELWGLGRRVEGATELLARQIEPVLRQATMELPA